MAPLIGDAAQISMNDVSLLGVICRAYDVKPLMVTAPEWMRNERYVIAAKPPADAPKGRVAGMLQSLLEDRFALRIRWETKDEQGFALQVAKGGAKLTKSTIAPEEAAGKQMTETGWLGDLMWKAARMDDLATSLTFLMGSPVVNRTQLDGVFDIKMKASPDSMPGWPFHSDATSNYPSIFDAVRGLGLNLEKGRWPVKRLVVVSANKVPTGN